MVAVQSRDVPIQGEQKYLIESSVLCVDMDGTLLRTDTLYECFLASVKARPALLLHVPFWLTRGRYGFKQVLTERARDLFHSRTCPREPEVEQLIRDARAQGRGVELVSAADHTLIEAQPDLVGMFDHVIGSRDGVNLKAEEKAALLARRHPEGFAYVGNSSADLPVWRLARERFGVNLPDRVRRRARAEGLDVVEIAEAPPLVPALLRSMRLHQWLKNLLMLVPFGLSLGHADLGGLLTVLVGFVLLGCLTSGTYLVNDLLDLESDRGHPRKRRRPIPSGDLPLPAAIVASLLLVGGALLGGLVLKPAFGGALLVYLAVTLAYSLRLKRMGLVDVLVIAFLFTLRIVAGMVLLEQAPSHWLLMFSIFFFTSLAFMKREVELNVMHNAGKQAIEGRGYALDDRIYVLGCGLSSSMASLVVFAMFVSATVELRSASYASPALLWGALAVIGYWILRMWLLTTRGLMDDDPILYAARDRTSLLLGAGAVLSVVAAQVVRL